MKIRFVILLSLPLLTPLLRADDAITQPAVPMPADKHAELKNQAPSDVKDIPKPVLVAKQKFSDEKKVLDQAIKIAVKDHGPKSPEAIEARRVAHERLAVLRQEIRLARERK